MAAGARHRVVVSETATPGFVSRMTQQHLPRLLRDFYCQGLVPTFVPPTALADLTEMARYLKACRFAALF